MGLLGNIIAKGVATVARNSTIKAVGDVAVSVIEAAADAKTSEQKVVIKNGTSLITPTRASEFYLNECTLEIAQELLCAGFENITLKPVNKLNDWSVKKYGRILSISINGKTDFLGVKRIPASSHIVIEYFDFKETSDPDVYLGVKRIVPGTIHDISDIDKMFQKDSNASTVDTKKYCPYCGEQVLNSNAKFCSICGKEL